MHRPTYAPVLCTGGGEIFFSGPFSRSRSERGENIGCFPASEASVTLFLLVVYSPGIIFELLMSIHHPHNSQRCEPGAAKLWKTLHPKQSQQPKKVPLVAGSWFSRLSRHSSVSNAGWPACGVVPKVHEDRVNFRGQVPAKEGLW